MISKTTITSIFLFLLAFAHCETQAEPVPIPLLADAVKSAAPGDTIVVRNGRYANLALQIEAAGTPTHSITIQPETPGGVVVTGQCRVTLTGSDLVFGGFVFERAFAVDETSGGIIILSDALRCRVTNNHFLECRTPNTPLGGIIIIERNSPATQIDHNTFEGSRCISIALRVLYEFPNNLDLQVDHNHFLNTPDLHDHFPDASSGMHAVQLGSLATFQNARLNALVEFNLFENIKGDGMGPITVNTSWNTIRYNGFVNSSAGPDLHHGHDCWVYGNVITHCATGMRIAGANHRVAGNVITDFETSGIALQMGSSLGHISPAHDALIANNTILMHRGSAVTFAFDPGARGGDVVSPQHVQFANNFILQFGGATINGPSEIDYAAAANLIARPDGLEQVALPEGFRLTRLPHPMHLTLPVEFERLAPEGTPLQTEEADSHLASDEMIWAGATQPGVKVRPLRVKKVGASFLNTTPTREIHP